MRKTNSDGSTFSSYNIHLNDETRHYMYHQSCLAVKESLQVLDTIDDINEQLRGIASKCHKCVKLHGNMMETLKEFSTESNFLVTLEEENGYEIVGGDRDDNEGERVENSEVKREECNENKNKENEEEIVIIDKGDIVMCTGGEERGANKYCTVMDVSPSRKTFILCDSEGKTFRKYAHCIQKYPRN